MENNPAFDRDARYSVSPRNLVSERTKTRALPLVFLVMLMDIVGLSILGPVAPYIMRPFSSDALTVTLLMVIYAAAQFFAAPALGKISDRVGRRPVLLVSVFGSAVGYFLFGIGGTLWVLFLSRLIDGITGGNLSTATAVIADVSQPEERAKNFTLMGIAYGLGFILGPALGGALGQVSPALPVLAAGAISLVSVGLIYFLLPETLPFEKRETAPLRPVDFNPFASIGAMARVPGIGRVLLATGLFNLAFDGINSTTALFMMDKFTAQPWHIGALFVVVGLATAIMQGTLVRTLLPKYGEKRMAVFSLLGEGIGAVGLFLAPALWVLFPVSFAQTLAVSFIFSALSTLAANRVSERQQGQLAGVSAAVNGLAAALGPLWAGAAYDHVMLGAPLWIGALILVVAVAVVARVKARETVG